MDPEDTKVHEKTFKDSDVTNQLPALKFVHPSKDQLPSISAEAECLTLQKETENIETESSTQVSTATVGGTKQKKPIIKTSVRLLLYFTIFFLLLFICFYMF